MFAPPCPPPFPPPCAGQKRVDIVAFAEQLYGFAASATSPLFGILLRAEKVLELQSIGSVGAPRGSISWSEFALYWNGITALHDAEALSKDAPTMTGGEGRSKYRPAFLCVRPLTPSERAALVQRRHARALRRRGGSVLPAVPPAEDVRWVGDWRGGKVPITTHPLWSQQLSDMWRGLHPTRSKASQLHTIIKYYRCGGAWGTITCGHYTSLLES